MTTSASDGAGPRRAVQHGYRRLEGSRMRDHLCRHGRNPRCRPAYGSPGRAFREPTDRCLAHRPVGRLAANGDPDQIRQHRGCETIRAIVRLAFAGCGVGWGAPRHCRGNGCLDSGQIGALPRGNRQRRHGFLSIRLTSCGQPSRWERAADNGSFLERSAAVVGADHQLINLPESEAIMTLSARFSPLHSDLNDFLFASVGDEQMECRSVSFGVDATWCRALKEAARLAALPKVLAAEALAPMIARLRWTAAIERHCYRPKRLEVFCRCAQMRPSQVGSRPVHGPRNILTPQCCGSACLWGSSSLQHVVVGCRPRFAPRPCSSAPGSREK